MALKDILVHIDSSPQCAARLDSAMQLAIRHDAHLTGLYVIPHTEIPGYIRAQITNEILEHHDRLIVDAAEQAKQMFTERTNQQGLTAEWRCVEGDLIPVLALHARYADVAIVGQRDPEGDTVSADPGMPDRLILSVGRPVLVIPNIGEYPNIGERVMVAWDASRLATRATNDAMPFMEGAKHVSVMAVNPRGGEEGHGEIPSADICLHLARHGINAEAQHVFADDVEAGDMLLSRAADEGIDLFVMGAYGHARWREVVLGGVTRHLLRHMTMPVLMSH